MSSGGNKAVNIMTSCNISANYSWPRRQLKFAQMVNYKLIAAMVTQIYCIRSQRRIRLELSLKSTDTGNLFTPYHWTTDMQRVPHNSVFLFFDRQNVAAFYAITEGRFDVSRVNKCNCENASSECLTTFNYPILGMSF